MTPNVIAPPSERVFIALICFKHKGQTKITFCKGGNSKRIKYDTSSRHILAD